MSKYSKKPVVIEAINFQEFVDYGLNNGGNIVNGMPWSFEYNGHGVTHENDECYLIPTLEGTMRFTPEDMLITGVNGEIYPCKIEIFEKTYEEVNQSSKRSKLNVAVSVKDTEVFQTLMNYTSSLVEILSDYPLSEEDEKKLNSTSKDFFSLKREVES